MKQRRKLLLALTGVSAATVWTQPAVDAVILPAHAATTSGTGCERSGTDISSEPRFVNFNGGNFLDCGAPVYDDSNCSNMVENTGGAVVYAPEGMEQADTICSNNGTGGVFAQSEDTNVWICLECQNS